MNKLNPQAQHIYQILLDGEWHCPIEWNYADGHTKRITDIDRFVAEQGLRVDSTWCDCGRHTAKIKKRRLVPIQESPVVQEFKKEYETRSKQAFQGVLI